MNKKIFSLDAETNGLWGQAFSIGCVWTTENGEVKQFVGRCPIEGEVDEWVSQNVLPKMEEIPITHSSYKELLKSFMEVYMKEKEGADVIVHMGLPVEARLFMDAHNLSIIGDWDAPYPLIDVSAYKEINDSVDNYNQKNGLKVPPCTGGTHNPIYDSYAALLAYQHYIKK